MSNRSSSLAMIDKESSKAYRKILSAETEFEIFTIVERLKPDVAKRVLMTLTMNKQLNK
ncbi:hypothetical protein IQ283_08910 (plasmid) [Alkalihalobacillus hwajinpoensis]|uniref:hypothetical protein n=1 Tax=Guptibacillus hwajinpoensis TaxID=208199 RepID=UPI001883DD45|nr:hypothetical protein [Pseudalkalibacillus hwajinpoensis]MBF0706726.1 hypothetical protein [Pseudalkalibacillus hwajinpoensis]